MPGFPLAQLALAAGNARNAYSTAKRDAEKEARDQGLKQALAMLQMQRQDQQDKLAAALQSLQSKNIQSQIDARNAPRPPVLDPRDVHAANRKYDIENPLPTTPAGPEPLEVVLQGGKRIYQPRSKATGMEAPSPAVAPPTNVYLPSTDPTTGQTTYTVVPNRGAVNPQETGIIRPQTASGEKVSDAQRLTAGFYQRMSEAGRQLADIESDPRNASALSGWVGSPAGTGRVPWIGNATLSPTMQQYQQAQRNWVRAKLRKESGAAIGNEEMQQEIETYFPQPNDSPAVKRQKAAARKEAEDVMRTAAGNAIKNDSGNIDLGADPIAKAGAWKAANPKRPDETNEAWLARFKAAMGIP